MASQPAQPTPLPIKRKSLTRRFAPDRSQQTRHIVQGLFVFISVISDRPAVMPTTLFRHLRVLGTNPADWVTSPVR